MTRRPSSLAFGAALLAAVTATAGLALTPTPARAAAPSHASGAPQKVIVLMRDQQTALPATAAFAGRRRASIVAADAPISRKITALGGRTTQTYGSIAVLAATVPAGGLAALRADPAVRAVVPDLAWRLPVPAAAGAGSTATSRAVPASSPASLCPKQGTSRLEPEALPLTHTDSDVAGAQTARSLGYTGAGVKVAFIADGLDPNDPDFIRADGTHVITDYRDFSGDGTASSSSGAEAFGDASGIAAQGRKSYDLSQYVNPAHPLPAGCDIRIEGMAPGASLVALKIFSNELLTAPTSTIIQAIDYAVNVNHVDVVNESFGSNPYPDNATDPISIANLDAVDAGVTVVASTGDAGLGGTMGTASTDPWVIGAGASTQERSYAQQDLYGFQLGNGKYTSNQLSALSSAGVAQTLKVTDLLAPGDLGWALCSAKLARNGSPIYGGCVNDNRQPSPIQDFGGTSQSSPLTSGAAALVIQAYRARHGGASPTPAQVHQVLDSSADDLGLPAAEQGAGLLNSYRAVQLAAALPGGTPSQAGNGLLLGSTQLQATAAGGASVTAAESVTNDSSSVQRVTAGLRQITHVIGGQTATVALSAQAPKHTFVDAFGSTRSYVKQTFAVVPGTDRLVVSTAETGTPSPSPARFFLLDPHGTYTAYSLPQGAGDYGVVDVHQPGPGTWTAVVFTIASASGYTGPVVLRTTDLADSPAGTVTPSSFTLAPGASRRLTVSTTVPAAGSAASSLVLTGDFGASTTAPFVTQAVDPVSARHPATFSGVFDAANGRDFGPAQTETYFFDVPAGAADLTVDLATSGTPPNEVIAHLSDPSGEPVSTALNEHLAGTTVATDSGLQIVHALPVAGRYQLTVELANPVAGAPLPQTFHGSVSLDGAKVTSTGVPSSTTTRVAAAGRTATVRIHNTSPQAQTYFVDPRDSQQATYTLLAVPPAVSTRNPYTARVSVPLQSDSDLPSWYVPTRVSQLVVGASATAPITMDMMPLDTPTAINSPNNPDIEATTSGRSATAELDAAEVGSSRWAAFPTLVGPDPAHGSATGQVTLIASIEAQRFATEWTPSTGDQLLTTVTASPGPLTPVTIPAGASATVTVRLAPGTSTGSTHRGTLFVDTISPFGAAGSSTLGDEVAAIPYAYTVG